MEKAVRPEPFRNISRVQSLFASGEGLGKQMLGRFADVLCRDSSHLERVILAEAIWRRIKPLPLYTSPDSSLVVPQMLTFAQHREVVND